MSTSKETVYYASGKRKTSCARVFLKPGSGKISINGRPADEYIQTPAGRVTIRNPFQLTDTRGKFDAYITVSGGGIGGQVGAIRHGISRALLVLDEDKYRPTLKKAGFLTRDSRMVERKKYGRHKARRSTQFSKR